jgi:anti-sigma factor RsiW
MKHPNQATLALHAGSDLPPFARWRTARHLAACDRCRAETADFEAMRSILPELAETPEIPWNRLAAEMKANIRLGLAAGECVRSDDAPLRGRPAFAGARATVAFVSVAALLVTGLILEHPAPVANIASYEGVDLRATANGIEVRGGGQSLQLLSGGAQPKDVAYTPGAQGSMRASYVDSETDQVTVASVYAN